MRHDHNGHHHSSAFWARVKIYAPKYDEYNGSEMIQLTRDKMLPELSWRKTKKHEVSGRYGKGEKS
jgi:hypothetical protein